MLALALALPVEFVAACEDSRDGGPAPDPDAEEQVAVPQAEGPDCSCACRVRYGTDCGEVAPLACASWARCCRCPDDCTPATCPSTGSPNTWCCEL